MSNIVIIATSYDTPCNYTFGWAVNLKTELLRQGHTCVLIPAEGICAAGQIVSEAIERSDFVVFFGHGTSNEMTRLPPSGTIPSMPLIDSATVALFNGKPVYAGCCSSLGGPGSGLGTAYANRYPKGSYIGYEQQFEFEYENEFYFGEVVVASVVQYVNGASAQKVAQDLSSEWHSLSNRFYAGNLKNNRNASMAGHRAHSNSQRVGAK